VPKGAWKNVKRTRQKLDDRRRRQVRGDVLGLRVARVVVHYHGGNHTELDGKLLGDGGLLKSRGAVSRREVSRREGSRGEREQR
jgi:hypothetical protein